jgi:HD-GYP domain-containing protein (c-di-GMP phosphodiesterase class II)
MTSDRPYRPAGTWEEAVAEITDGARTQFDPDVVDVFREREEALRRIYMEFNLN